MCEEIMIFENQFDRLPDDIVCLILNRVHHAKSLCACLAVSSRFNSLALLSTNLSLSVDRIHFDDDGDGDDEDGDEYSDLSSSKDSLLRSLFKLFISTPLRFLTRLASSSRGVFDSSSTGATFYSPTQALKSFENIQILKIQLPSHRELQFDSSTTTTNPILKWKATFGSELKTCVIVAATSVVDSNPDNDSNRRDAGFEIEMNEKVKEELHQQAADAPHTTPFAISNEDLKMRVVWTISCLIAASSRHHLLKRVVSQHPTLKSIEMVDQHRQGTLTMDESDISQMRESLITQSNSDSRSSDEGDGERSRIPAVKMKMWHAAELELPECKKVMKGATLVVIGAGDGVGEVEVEVEEVFEEEEEVEGMMYGEAAREIRRKMKRSYSLEMESF